jgi:membrane peptidoglycan carboxypeptidase
MSATAITGSIDIWRDFMRQMVPNGDNEKERRLVKEEIEYQAEEEEAERRQRATDEREYQEGQQIEIMVHTLDDNDEDEDNGSEGADEEFARRHQCQDDVIDEIIAMSELESNLNEHQ